MAETADSVDIGSLNASQQEALQQYTSVTDQEASAAIPLLQRSEWNVQIAITKFFDGETADPLEEARRQAASVPTQSGSSGVLLDDLHTSSIRYRRPVPRPGAGGGIGGQGNGNGAGWRPPLLLMILFSPFTLVYRILTGGINLISDLWSGPPPPQVRPPRRIDEGPSAEQQARQNLRTEQETAFERSLAADREKARLRKEAETQKAREEKRARDREQWKRWRASTLDGEPPAEDKSAPRLSIRLTDGQRVVRRFAPSATMEELFAFVECQDVEVTEKTPGPPEDYEHEYGFKLVQTMPRTVYLPDSAAITQRVGRSAQLIVEPNETEEDE